jgi:hypothetical protein
MWGGNMKFPNKSLHFLEELGLVPTAMTAFSTV